MGRGLLVDLSTGWYGVYSYHSASQGVVLKPYSNKASLLTPTLPQAVSFSFVLTFGYPYASARIGTNCLEAVLGDSDD